MFLRAGSILIAGIQMLRVAAVELAGIDVWELESAGTKEVGQETDRVPGLESASEAKLAIEMKPTRRVRQTEAGALLADAAMAFLHDQARQVGKPDTVPTGIQPGAQR
jgi:hypothetical protein